MAEISAELTLKLTQFQAGLQKAQAETAALRSQLQSEGRRIASDFGSSLNTAFSAITGGYVAGKVRELVEEYGHLADISQRFDTDPEGMQRLGFHAKMAGTDLESAANAVGKLQVALENTSDPAVVAALKELRLTAFQLAGESPERQFQLLAEAFNRAQMEGRGLAATKALLGKGFSELLPMIREWNEIASKKISVVSGDDVKLLKEAGDTWESIVHNSKVAAATILLHPEEGLFKNGGSGAQNNWANAWMGQGGINATAGRSAITETKDSGGNWMEGLMAQLAKAEEYAKSYNTKLESYRRVQEANAEAEKKAKEAEDKIAKEQQKAREGVNSEEQSVRIAELRASGHKTEADKLERLQKGQREFQRLRDAHPEMGEQWALDMAHRKDAAENMKPGRIHGYTGKAPAPHAGLDWLYGHNRDKGGQAMNKEFKFPSIDEMNRTLKSIEKLLE